MDERLGSTSCFLESSLQAPTALEAVEQLERAPSWNSAIASATADHLAAAMLEQNWQALSEMSADLLRLLSLLAPAAIPWGLVEAVTPQLGWEEAHVDTARMQLYGQGFLQLTDQGNYQIVAIALDFARSTVEQFPQLETFQQAISRGIAEIAKQLVQTCVTSQSDAVVVILPHLEVVATNLIDHVPDDLLQWCFTALGHCYCDRASYEQAEFWYERGLSVAQSRLGPDHPSVAISLSNLACLYERQNRLEAAEALQLEALTLSQRIWGERDLNVAINLNNLAGICKRRGNFEHASALYQQALQIRVERLGNQHPTVATSLSNLAGLHLAQGNYRDAEPLYLRALQLRRCLLGSNHPAVALSLNNLAGLYFAQGRYAQAVAMGQQVVQLSEQVLGPQHPETIARRHNLQTMQLQQDAQRSRPLSAVGAALAGVHQLFR